jgi:hypothetical protein
MIGSGKITRRQEAVIASLLEMPTMAAAAKGAGISEPTLRRWLLKPDFQDAYRQAKRQVVEQAVTVLQQATGDAVSTLRCVMLDKEAPASSRVAAAKTVLETAIKAVELEDLAGRIEELEQILSQGGRGNAERSC